MSTVLFLVKFKHFKNCYGFYNRLFLCFFQSKKVIFEQKQCILAAKVCVFVCFINMYFFQAVSIIFQ